MWNELVPSVLADELLQMIQKREPFLVRDATKCIIRVLSFEVGDEFGEFVVCSKLANTVGERFPAYNCGKVSVRLPVNDCLYASF